jgi:hypothetical protein
MQGEKFACSATAYLIRVPASFDWAGVFFGKRVVAGAFQISCLAKPKGFLLRLRGKSWLPVQGMCRTKQKAQSEDWAFRSEFLGWPMGLEPTTTGITILKKLDLLLLIMLDPQLIFVINQLFILHSGKNCIE